MGDALADAAERSHSAEPARGYPRSGGRRVTLPNRYCRPRLSPQRDLAAVGAGEAGRQGCVDRGLAGDHRGDLDCQVVAELGRDSHCLTGLCRPVGTHHDRAKLAIPCLRMPADQYRARRLVHIKVATPPNRIPVIRRDPCDPTATSVARRCLTSSSSIGPAGPSITTSSTRSPGSTSLAVRTACFIRSWFEKAGRANADDAPSANAAPLVHTPHTAIRLVAGVSRAIWADRHHGFGRPVHSAHHVRQGRVDGNHRHATHRLRNLSPNIGVTLESGSRSLVFLDVDVSLGQPAVEQFVSGLGLRLPVGVQ